jgi:hypothetical protein
MTGTNDQGASAGARLSSRGGRESDPSILLPPCAELLIPARAHRCSSTAHVRSPFFFHKWNRGYLPRWIIYRAGPGIIVCFLILGSKSIAHSGLQLPPLRVYGVLRSTMSGNGYRKSISKKADVQ